MACRRPAAPRKPDLRPNSADRGYGSKWRIIRAQFLKQNPVCICGAPASEAHHKIPYKLTQDNSWANLQALCKSCHSKIRDPGEWQRQEKEIDPMTGYEKR
jgi:5-methylcytosine-specific restriction endonuclease McrA